MALPQIARACVALVHCSGLASSSLDRTPMPELAPSPDCRQFDRELISAFARTHYLAIDGRQQTTLRIGAPVPLALSRRFRGRSWAVVTAYNPAARIVSMTRNRRADRRLGRCLARLRPSLLLRTIHRSPGGDWPDEHGWLFCPAPHPLALRLGQHFGQVAVVIGRPGHAAEIFECDVTARHNATGNRSPADWRFAS